MNSIKKHKYGLAVFAVLVVLVSMLFICTREVSAASVGNATAYVKTGDGAYMRKSFSTSSAKVKLLADGTKVSIIRETFATSNSYDTNKRWFYINVNGTKGYIRADMLKNFSYNGATGVVKSKVNYRAGAGTGMPLRGSLKAGTRVDVRLIATPYKSDAVWYKIKLDSGFYYLNSRWITLTESSSSSNSVSSSNTSTTTPKATATPTPKATATPTPKATATPTPTPTPAIKTSGTPNFTISNLTYPTTTYTGCSFVLKGTIKADMIIQKATFGVKDGSGNWIISKTVDVNDTSFNIATIDNYITFGILGAGSYTYQGDLVVDGKTYTKVSYSFKVVKATAPAAITSKAFEIAWPNGTATSKYKYSGGDSTAAFKTAIASAYPNRSSWGAAPKVGASCDVFVGVVVRSSGYDSSFPRGLDDQWEYLAKSNKWQQVTASKSNLKTGDIIVYSTGSGGHICLYVEKNGSGYIAEAAYSRYYGYINTYVSSRISSSGKQWVKVYRAVS